VPTELAIQINQPASGNVSGGGTFSSWGLYTISPTETVTVQEWVSNASTGVLVAYGTATDYPLNNNWGFKFSGLSVGVGYVLTAQATAQDGTISSQSISITCTSP
jgi:hypothetical protein